MRLTKRTVDNAAVVCENCPKKGSCHIPSSCLTVMTNKLCDYEDAEEQGLLIRLPCNVGDKVYALERFCDGNIRDCYSWLKCEECEDYQQEVITRRIGTLLQAVSVIEMLGKTVFLTHEEAEAALKGETR